MTKWNYKWRTKLIWSSGVKISAKMATIYVHVELIFAAYFQFLFHVYCHLIRVPLCVLSCHSLERFWCSWQYHRSLLITNIETLLWLKSPIHREKQGKNTQTKFLKTTQKYEPTQNSVTWPKEGIKILRMAGTVTQLSTMQGGGTVHNGHLLMVRGIIQPRTGHEGAKWGSVVNTTPRPPLPPGKTWYPSYRRLGGAQGRSGQVQNIFPPPPTGIRSPDRPDCSESQYRLTFRGLLQEHRCRRKYNK